MKTDKTTNLRADSEMKQDTMETKAMKYGFMTVFFRKLKRTALVLACMGLVGFASTLYAQEDLNGTQQLPNRGFEDYDNLGSENVEPRGWNSFMTAKTAGGLVDMGKAKRLDRKDGGRPGTSGSYYLQVYSTEVIGINANGNVTTGRINMGSATATDASNHNFTDRASAGFNLPFTMVPDSMVVWIRYSPNSASDKGQIRAIIHNDNDVKDPGTDYNQVVAVATVNPTKTNGWVRFSVPFSREGCGSQDARYCLVSITTNATPGGGAATIDVDDILFVYKPALSITNLPMLSFNMRDGAQTASIDFRITGTMSPNTHPANPNQVIAELSDASGSFASPREIGRLTTDFSGSLPITIPADMPLGEHYRIRLRSTNYPLVSADNGQDIELMRGYTIAASVQGNGGTVSGAGGYAEGETVTLTANPYNGYHFVCWQENGKEVEGAGQTYSFAVDEDRSLVAVFELNQYVLKMSVEGEGSVSPEPGEHVYAHNSRVELRAEALGNYEFGGFYNGDVLLSANPVHTFNIVSDMEVKALFEQGKIRITALANNDSYGRVGGGGTYEYGAEVVLTAVPNPFCRFVAWVEGSDTLSKETEWRFMAEEARTVQALFDQQYFEVALAAEPAQGGSVSGGGRFGAAQANTTVAITAQPAAGYHFLYWVDERDQSRITENPYTVIEESRLTENLRFTAHFEAESYEVELASDMPQAAQLQGTGSYAYQEEVVLEAEMAEGYLFGAWVVENAQGGIDTLSVENPYSFRIQDNWSIKALFNRIQHQITVVSGNEAMGTASGSGLYFHFDSVKMEASALEGYEFRYWAKRQGVRDDSVASANPWKMEVKEDATYAAVFSERRKLITALAVPEEGGKVNGGGLYENGSYALLQPVAAPYYHFAGWGTADSIMTAYPQDLRIYVQKDTTLYAHFEPDMLELEVMVDGLSPAGQVEVVGLTGEGPRFVLEQPYGRQVHLRASVLDEEYRFVAWRLYYTDENGMEKDSLFSREMEVRFDMSGNIRMVAEFGMGVVNVAASVQPQDAGKVENQGNYAEGQWAALRAVAAPGYAFDYWADAEGGLLSRLDVCYVQAVNDTSVMAVFKTDTLEIGLAARLDMTAYGLEADGNSVLPGVTGRYEQASGMQSYFGEISGKGRYPYGSEVRLEAEAGYGYEFKGWFAAGDTAFRACLEESPVYVFDAEDDALMVALFAPALFRVDLALSDETAGTVEGAGNYAYKTEARLRAEAAQGYVFEGWEVADAEGGLDTLPLADLGWPVEANASLRALFSLRVVRAEARVMTGQGLVAVGTATAAGQTATASFTYGDEAVLRAEAAPCHTFSSWQDAAGNLLSSESEWKMRVTDDTLVYAVFAPQRMSVSAQAFDARQGYVEASSSRPEYGSVLSLSAMPMPGYAFSHWTGASDTTVWLSASSVLRFDVLSDTSLYAFFEPAMQEVSVSVPLVGAGQVVIRQVSDSDTLSWTGLAVAENGSELILEAVAMPGYRFSAWEAQGRVLGEDSRLVLDVDQDLDVEAVFEPTMYRIDVAAEPEAYGSVKGSGMFAYGQEVLVEALPNSVAYAFLGWKSDDRWVSDEASYRFLVSGERSLAAVFAPDSASVGLLCGLGGSVQGAGLYAVGSPVSLSATAYPGYAFDYWSDADGNRISAQNPLSLTADKDTLLRAVFASATYLAEVSAGIGGSVSGGGEFLKGETAVLVAVADAGYRFAYWNLNGGEQTYPLACLMLAMDGDLQAEAIFEPMRYDISTVASPVVAGSVTAGGSFASGSTVSFEAVADANHEFAAWTKDGKVVSTEAVLSVSVDSADAAYVALFNPKMFNILVETYPSAGGLALGAGSYYWGDTADISVAVYPGFTFKSWSDMAFNTVSDQVSFRHVVNGVNMFTAALDGNVAIEDVVYAGRDGLAEVRVYPNPVGAERRVWFRTLAPEMRRLYFFDLQGNRVMERRLSERGQASVAVDVSVLPSGIYFYRVEMTDGSVGHGKLICL